MVKVMLLSFIAMACITSCKKRSENVSAAKRYEYDDSTCTSTMKFRNSGPFKSVTACRLAALASYGEQILTQTKDHDDVQNIATSRLFDIYGINQSDRAKVKIPGTTQLKEVYRITPTVGSLCFNDEESSNLYWDNWFVDKISGPKKQIEAIAEFIAEHHALLGGVNDGPFSFRQVEFCPADKLNAKMKYSQGKLEIGIPKDGRSFAFYNTAELKKMWDSGEIFSEAFKAEGMSNEVKEYLFGRNKNYEKIWQIMNPTGLVRTTFRSGLSSNAKAGIEKIRSSAASILKAEKSATGSGESDATAEVLSDNSDDISQFLESQLGVSTDAEAKGLKLTSNDNLKVGPLSVYNNHLNAQSLKLLKKIIETKKMGQFLKEWSCRLDNKILANQVSAIAQTAICRAVDSQMNVKYNLKNAFINIANFHNIDVCAGFSIGGLQDYVAPVVDPANARHKSDFNFEVEADGWLNVVTGDNVNVTALIEVGKQSVARTIQTKSFVDALEHTAANKTASCN